MMYAKFKHSTELNDTNIKTITTYLSHFHSHQLVFERIVYDQFYEPHK